MCGSGEPSRDVPLDVFNHQRWAHRPTTNQTGKPKREIPNKSQGLLMEKKPRALPEIKYHQATLESFNRPNQRCSPVLQEMRWTITTQEEWLAQCHCSTSRELIRR